MSEPLKATHPRFDWSRVKWGGPRDRISYVCGYCGDAIDEEGVPLRLFREDGSAAVFCDPCSEAIFALKKF